MNRFLAYVAVTLVIVLAGVAVFAQLDLTTFTPNTPIRSSEVNDNFQAVADALEATVRSLNTLVGDVNLLAGDNVNVVVDATTGDVTISSTAQGTAGGDITGVEAGVGLAGGGDAGVVTLRVANSYRLPQDCANGEIPEWDGVVWGCGLDDVGTGGGGDDITAVNPGVGLTGGGESGSVTLSVDFANSGMSDTAARGDHDHLGQTWNGLDDPLVVAGSFSFDPFVSGEQVGAPLVLANSDSSGFGLRLTESGDDGIHIDSAGNAGLRVDSAGGEGVRVESAGGDGVRVASSSGDGLSLGSIGGDGVYISSVSDDGVQVLTAGDDGIVVSSAGGDGMVVDSAAGNGVVVGSAGSDGVLVSSAAGDGVQVASADGAGVFVASSGGEGVLVDSAGDDGVRVDQAVAEGFQVDAAGGDGVRVRSAGDNGIQVDSADRHGVSVVFAGDDGLRIIEALDDGINVEMAGHIGLWVQDATDDGVRVQSAGRDGVDATSTSSDHYGGRFMNSATDGAGVFASGGSFSSADLVLGGATGYIVSDPGFPNNGINLSSNNGLVVTLDQDVAIDSNLIVEDGSGTTIFDLSESGDLTITGTLTDASDLHAKMDIALVDTGQVLEGLMGIPISTWRYRDRPEALHLGPMAQDFHAAFGLGASPTGISTVDRDGVALAAIQGLYAMLIERDVVIAEQQRTLVALENRLTALEEALARSAP